MNLWLNVLIILLIIGVMLFLLAWRVLQRNSQRKPLEDSERTRFSIPVIKQFVLDRTTQLATANLYNLGLTEEEFNRQVRRRKELKEALKNCNTGDFGSKTYVREFLYELLLNEYGFNETNIDWVMPFDTPSRLETRDMFDILLYLQWKEHGAAGLGKLIDEYDLAEPKEDGSYRIYGEEIKMIYKEKVKYLSFEDKLRIIVQRVYSHFKGFGVIDDIRDMTIDGVSGGVSGLPKRMETMEDEEKLFSLFGSLKTGLNSVWIMYKGKSIHLAFLEFDHEAELRRVVQNIYKYNFPGQLSESRPYIINEMHDGSRVTVVRPKLSESWAFFIRKKYDIKKLEVNQLITHPNAELPIELMKYLMKGARITALTGAQGSGKTTLLMALVSYIHKALNLRVQETSFELNLRTLYPDRNILTFQETEDVSGQDGLDLQKKTDGAVNILGEVATDPVAAWMIQTAQVASLFTVFTHHAKTARDLVYALRNSLLKEGMFSNEAIAEQQVVSVLEFNIHLNQRYDGTRYVERITELIPVSFEPKEIDAITNESTKEDKVDALLTVATNYFMQQTQKQQFEARNIIEFVDGRYVARNPISQQRLMEMDNHLSKNDRLQFRSFIEGVWGHAQ